MSDITEIRDAVLASDFADRVDEVLESQRDGSISADDFDTMASILRLPADLLHTIFAVRLALRTGEPVTILPGHLGGMN